MTVTVHHGDSRDVLKALPSSSIDAIVTDPPYALVSIGQRFGKDGAAPARGGVYARASSGFMGQKWDTGETAFAADFWAEALRVLKPGGHLIAFGGTRSYHRLVCAIEDGGFEVRDQLAWLYGSGFPKSHDVSKGIDRAAGVEREVVGRAVYGDGHTQNSKESIGYGGSDPAKDQRLITRSATPEAAEWSGWGTALKPALEPICLARKPLVGTVAGNVLAHGTGALNIDACRIGDEGGTAKAEPVPSSRTVNAYGNGLNGGGVVAIDAGRWPANVVHDGSAEVLSGFPESANGHWSGETPSLTGKQRKVGEERSEEAASSARFFYTAKADADDRLGSKHPTVKPLSLMRWLVRLVTRPGAVVLDPFAGTGTTGLAALAEGRDAILIEREEPYVADIHRRLAWVRGEGRLSIEEKRRGEPPPDDSPFFGSHAQDV